MEFLSEQVARAEMQYRLQGSRSSADAWAQAEGRREPVVVRAGRRARRIRRGAW